MDDEKKGGDEIFSGDIQPGLVYCYEYYIAIIVEPAPPAPTMGASIPAPTRARSMVVAPEKYSRTPT